MLAALAALGLLLAFSASAQARVEVCAGGAASGGCDGPEAIAIDASAKRLYAADFRNDRVDVFDVETGDFIEAFGWGVLDGKSKLQVCTVTCRKGLVGDGSGQFSEIWGLAVDPTSHDLYVSERGNRRVQKFDPLAGAGEVSFLLMFGGGVDQTTGGDVCTAASGDLCGLGSNGTGEGEFSFEIGSNGLYVGVGPAGNIFVIDSSEVPGEFRKYSIRLQRFEPSGAVLTPQHILVTAQPEGARGLAVDSTGDLWITTQAALEKFAANGTPLLSGPIALPSPWGITVNSEAGQFPKDSVMVSAFGELPVGTGDLTLYGSDGSVLKRFGYGAFTVGSPPTRFQIDSLATFASSLGDIFASQSRGANPGGGEGRVFSLDFPPPGPLFFPAPCTAEPVGNTSATLKAEINPEGKATAYHFELVTDALFQHDEEELGPGHGFDQATRVPAQSSEDPSLPEDFELHTATAVAPVAPETKYHCRAAASNADGIVEGEPGTFTSRPPVGFGPTFASAVGPDSAVISTELSPEGIPTTGYFEYVDQAHFESEGGFASSQTRKIPDVGSGQSPIDFGSGNAFKLASVQLTGLVPNTVYRYRIVAIDSFFPNGITDPLEPGGKAFRTFASPGPILPDGRAWELVSPGQKESAEVGCPSVACGISRESLLRIQAAAGSGEAITYTSWTSFGQPQGAPSSSQYLSRRTAAGWATENISPFGTLARPIEPPYRGFSRDLSTAGFVVSEPLLAPGAQPGFENLYLRDNEGGDVKALTVLAPQFIPAQSNELNVFCTGYAGSSADGSRAFFAADGAMAGAPAGVGFSLYEWSAAAGLSLVSVLPNGTAATPSAHSSFGAAGENNNGSCTVGQAIIANSVSSAGSRVFWTYGGTYKEGPETSVAPLLVRIDGSETRQLDKKAAGAAGPSGEGRFWAATPDGSSAFFTAPGKLTADAGAGGDLYRYDTAASSLTDLTPGPVAPEIKGVIGASDDGTHVYFVGAGALTGAQENGVGEKAESGRSNLYLWQQGEGLRFIARLANETDGRDWSSGPEQLEARVTPSGQGIAFVSVESKALSGYDNERLGGGDCVPRFPEHEDQLTGGSRCPEAYLYDAATDQLTCASCNPAGSRPAGPAQFPGWTNPLEGPRYLSDDGERLFFESRDTLVPEDENHTRDIYEFEKAGFGTCSSDNSRFVPSSGGCVFLLSNGKSSAETYLLDASSSGRDVFFATRSVLVGWDVNENYDVYDVRAGGGLPEPQAPAQPCEGETCKPGIPPAPPGASAATPSFNGPGNPKPAACKKGKVRRGGKCVKKHNRKHHEKKSHAKSGAHRAGGAKG
jgi:hypothetical protein